MTLDEAVAAIEGKFPAHPEDGNYALSATAEEYVEIVPGGVNSPGERRPVYASTEEVAVRLWYDAVMDYAEGKSGTLYWRCRPLVEAGIFREIDEKGKILSDFSAIQLWYVYSRLLISDKPVVRPAFLHPEAPA